MTEELEVILAGLSPPERLPLRVWAERWLYLPRDYKCPPHMRGPYSMARHYLAHEIVEAFDCPTVREVTIVKPVQWGMSQNVFLPLALRALHWGDAVIFATAEAEQAEAFRIERFLPLLRASSAFREIQIRERETEVYLSNGGLLTFIHNRSKGGVESRSAAVVLADEFDSYEPSVLERLRGRLTQYEQAGAKLVKGSALKPNAKRIKLDGQIFTPATLEYRDSSQATPHIVDPKTGHLHPLEFGFIREDKSLPPWGVKWAADARRDDGSWNEARIAETVHYVTPDGTTFGEADRERLMAGARWIHAIPERAQTLPGFRLNCLWIAQKSLDNVAIGFLRAKRQGGDVYRTYMLENWCELPWLEKVEITDKALAFLQGKHKRGQTMHDAGAYAEVLKGCPTCNVMAIDVQAAQNGLWWLDADFYDTRTVPPEIRDKHGLGDEVTISLRDWGHGWAFKDLHEISLKFRARHVALDCNFRTRLPECHAAALEFQFTPVIGRDTKNFSMAVEAQEIDPMAGKRGQRKPLVQLMFQTDPVKHDVFELLNKRRSSVRLVLPENVDAILTKQLTAEQLIDGEFEQVGKDNHLYDCLVYILLLAKFRGLMPS